MSDENEGASLNDVHCALFPVSEQSFVIDALVNDKFGSCYQPGISVKEG
jgi:hypothetical protein